MRLLRFTLSLHEPFQVFLLCRPAVHILYTVGYQDKGRPLICNVPANWLQHFKGVLTLAPKLLWHTKLEQTVCCELVFVICKDGAEMFKGSAVLRRCSFQIIVLLIDPGHLAAGLLEDVKMLPTPVTSQIQSKNTQQLFYTAFLQSQEQTGKRSCVCGLGMR